MSTSWWSTACQVSSTICESPLPQRRSRIRGRFSLQCAFIGRPDWLAGLPDPAAFYTPDEEQYEPESLFRRDRKPPARKATPTGAGVKPKRPTAASPAVEIKGLSEFLPKISQQLERLTQRPGLCQCMWMGSQQNWKLWNQKSRPL